MTVLVYWGGVEWCRGCEVVTVVAHRQKGGYRLRVYEVAPPGASPSWAVTAPPKPPSRIQAQNQREWLRQILRGGGMVPQSSREFRTLADYTYWLRLALVTVCAEKWEQYPA